MIFVVDDDEAVRDSLAMLFEAEGFETRSYDSGRDFLERYAEDSHRTGCLVLDIRMPGMTGLELQQQLNEQGIGLPVIFITGHGDVPMAVRAMRAGARDFFEKPYDVNALVERVRECAEAHKSGHARIRDRQQAARLLAQLTSREREVLELLVLGKANKAVAHELGISARTVEVHRARIMEKLGARSLSEVVRLALTVEEGVGT